MNNFDLMQKREGLWEALRVAACETPFNAPAFAESLALLDPIDRLWSFPGREVRDALRTFVDRGQWALAAQLAGNVFQQLQWGKCRRQAFSAFQTPLERLSRPVLRDSGQLDAPVASALRPYFDVLVVHPFPEEYEALYRQQLASFKSAQDEFLYDLVFVNSAQDALTAVLANTGIQACIYLQHVAPSSLASTDLFLENSVALLASTPPVQVIDSVEVNLSRSVRCLRPDIDHILISELSALEVPAAVRSHFDRVLFHINPFQDLHAAILGGVRNRFSTPFFDALQAYSRQPKSVFHALPLSRGASVKDSPWASDMLDFYGDNIFLAETSSTQGGLDSLLDPTGAIKQSHNKAAQTFGADASYFVTNGTSTSNKIVMQANVHPGDIVLISADCHKSIPYAVMLAGAYPIFLETYPLVEYDLYGGIALAQIKAVMLDLKNQGRLHLLKQITLTNSTFDGLIYHAEKFMMEILAIKPDVIFHWDEAWFAFGHFHPLYHSRTAMSAVRKIRERMADPAYHQFYARWHAAFEADSSADKWQQALYPDPSRTRVRVYATQSTHKTLTAFRQGSMIHVADDLFHAAGFLEAFRIHTSTSPNYQIIASLDIGRRQAALEGFHRVREALRLSLQLRRRIKDSVDLQPYFNVLGDEEMVPQCYRSADAANSPMALANLSAVWGESDFVIDPTRVTLDLRNTGMDGSSFRQLLMTRYDIQVNKTSRHTVLFLINIGATQASIDYLVQVLLEMAAKFKYERRNRHWESASAEATVVLPSKRRFHSAFTPFEGGEFCAGDIRAAYFDGLTEGHAAYVSLSNDTLARVSAGQQWVSASFVTPYPPGFPVLVPGQIITTEILHYFQNCKVREIHGFHPELGFKVFTDTYLAKSAITYPEIETY